MGALVGGLYAQEGDIISGAARVKQYGTRMSTFWRLATDLTWPVVAYTTVSVFLSTIRYTKATKSSGLGSRT